MQYTSNRPLQEALRCRLRELAATHVRYGYRRLTVLLRREGWRVNAKRVYRLYDQENLKVRSVERKKISRRQRVSQGPATGPNQCWSADFVSDKLTDGRSYRILTVIDQFTRECVALEADRSLHGRNVVAALTGAITEPWQGAAKHHSGQRQRVHRTGAGSLGDSARGPAMLHPPRTPGGERLHRKLQRATARRVPERGVVRISSSCTRKTGAVAKPLQPATTA